MNIRFALLLVLGLLAFSLAYEVSKVRRSAPKDWKAISRAQSRAEIPFRIALKQRNMDVLERMVLDKADPSSPNYGKWLGRDELLDLVAPPSQDLQKVLIWLASNGFSNCDGSGRDFVKCKGEVNKIEKLFNVNLHVFRHEPSGKLKVSHVGTLSMPSEIEDIVSFVSGISELWEPSHIKPHTRGRHIRQGGPMTIPGGYIIPESLRYLYGIPHTWYAATGSVAVVEFQDDSSFDKDDLTYFNKQVDEKIKVDKIVGPYAPDYPDGESTLDVQYAFSIALNNTAWFWTVDGWMYEFATDLVNTPNPPLAVSMSWGWPENQQCQIDSNCTDTREYVERVDNEFLKATSLGITLTASSGDQGAPGDNNPYCISPILSTIFPGASPWVVSVGATAQDPNGSETNWAYHQPACEQFQCTNTSAEIVCSYPNALITTGGGFSDYVKVPAWQKEHTKKYLSNPSSKLPPSKYFDSKNRGFPDVSASGHAYLIGISGSLEQVDGTSCSSPVFAGIISLFNVYRKSIGKPPLGFVNPALYNAPASVWNDITEGNNYATESCIGTYGFTAVKGWDPVTGLGTPKFGPLFKYIKTLA